MQVQLLKLLCYSKFGNGFSIMGECLKFSLARIDRGVGLCQLWCQGESVMCAARPSTYFILFEL